MPVQKNYLYKVFNPTGNYLGLLQGVNSEFTINYLLSSAFAQMQITVAQSADNAALTLTPLQDEAGNIITDETGDPILPESAPAIVGSGTLIYNNNLIQVVEYSQYHPNGIIVYSGYISKWKTNFGNDENILITCISLGQDLNNYLIQSGDIAYITQATQDGSNIAFNTTGGSGKGIGQLVGGGQSFVMGATKSVDAIAVEMALPEAGTLSIEVYQGTPYSGDIIGDPVEITMSRHFTAAVAQSIIKLTANAPTTLASGVTYYFIVFWQPDNNSSTANATIYYSASNPYASGNCFGLASSGTYYFIPSADWFSGGDLYFVLYQHGGSLSGQYLNNDPSYMLTDIMSNYTSRGGGVQIPQPTGANVQSLYSDNNIGGAYWGTAFAQIITPSSNLTINALQINAYISGGGSNTFSVQVCKGNPALDQINVISGIETYQFGTGNSLIGSSDSVTVSNSAAANVNINFSTPVSLTSGVQYYLLVNFGQGGIGNLKFSGGSSGESPADTQVGKFYAALASINNASFGMTYSSTFPQMYFLINASGIGGYANTGVVSSYNFKFQTVWQGIQAIAALAPASWYYFVDPATNTLQFKQSSNTADITIVKGKHINNLDIEATKEGIINTVYFTGGDDGTGTSTDVLTVDTAALGDNRVGLEQLSDNRVSEANLGSLSAAQAVAHQLGQNELSTESEEQYQTTLVLIDGTIDDDLLLQVVGLTRYADSVSLQLGVLPLRSSQATATLKADLSYQQTVDAPATAS
jgi:hypothetical protein